MNKVTLQQEKFIQNLIKGKSQREAYRMAYPKNKGKDKTIDEAASRLFANSKVQARYQELMQKVLKKSEEECIVTTTEIIRELKKIAFADMKNFLSFKTAKTVMGYEDDGTPIVEIRPVIDFKDSEEVDTTAIQKVSLSPNGNLSFEMHSKMSALDKLAKHLGMFTDKVEVSGKIENPFENLTPEQLMKLVGDEDEDY